MELYLCRADGLEGSYAKLVVKSNPEQNAGIFQVGGEVTVVFDSGATKYELMATPATPTGVHALINEQEEEDYQRFQNKDCAVSGLLDEDVEADGGLRSQNIYTKAILNAYQLASLPHTAPYGTLAQKAHCSALRFKRNRLQEKLPKTKEGTHSLRLPLPWKIQKVLNVGFMDIRVQPRIKTRAPHSTPFRSLEHYHLTLPLLASFRFAAQRRARRP